MTVHPERRADLRLPTLETPQDLACLAQHWGLAPVVQAEPLTLEPHTRAICIARTEGLELYRVDHPGAPPAHARLKTWMRHLHAHGPGPHHRIIAAYTPTSQDAFTLAAPLLGEPRLTLVTSRIPTTARTPDDTLTLETLLEVGAHASGTAEVLLLGLERVLERRPLGQAFVRDFRAASQRLAQAWNHVPEDAHHDRHELAFVTLSRLLFLSFVQARGWLDQQPDFLAARIAQAEARGADPYREVLLPLFHGALNTPVHARSARARQLGAIPFLNGGLFAESPAEQAHPRRTLPTALLRTLIDELFAPYIFTTAERAEHQRSIDPVMLGQVFEALMQPEERNASGSFYTPQRIVRRLVTESLVAHAEHALPHVERHALIALFHDAKAAALTTEDARTLDHHLHHLRILDPAAGSGAFIVGAFHALQRARTALAQRLGPDALAPRALRLHIATHNLYGVDLLPRAIRLCELRLWLALSSGMEATDPTQLPPLPNLDLRLRTGDSLLEPYPTHLPETSPEHGHRLIALKNRYLHATQDAKAQLALEITRQERALFAHQLEQATTALDTRLGALQRLAKNPDLFGGPRGLNTEERTLREQLIEERARLETHRRQLSDPNAPLPGFAYALHFAEITQAGGFDIVIGNPPWLRPHRQSRSQKLALRKRYQVYHHGSWKPGATLGRGLKAPQVDLSAVFVERALRLAAPEAIVCMLVPAKLFRSLSGASLRRVIDTSAHTLGLIDWSRAPDRLFGRASTFPAMLLLRKSRDSERPPVVIERARPDGHFERFSLPARDLPLHTGDAASPWILVEPGHRHALRSMARAGCELGCHRRLMRGIVTGSNRVFIPRNVVAPPGAPHLIAHFRGPRESHIERELFVPALSGADIGAFAAHPSRLLLMPHDTTGAPLPALPRGAAEHLAHHRSALLARSDLRASQPPWTLFRVRPECFGPKVVWRDIAKRLEAAFVPASNPHPILGHTPIVPLNTVYYCPVPDPDTGYLLAALLNAQPARTFCDAIAEHAKDNHRRFFSWIVGLLPDPLRSLDPSLRQELIDASQALHGHTPTPLDPERREILLARINTLIRAAYLRDDLALRRVS